VIADGEFCTVGRPHRLRQVHHPDPGFRSGGGDDGEVLVHGEPVQGIGKKAGDWLRRVGLTGFEDRNPHQLFGGMRKWAALAQSPINEPRILLMDEPFSARAEPTLAASMERPCEGSDRPHPKTAASRRRLAERNYPTVRLP